MARILLIEDDDAVRQVVHMVLAHHGHEVLEAANGRAGVDLYACTGADLVLTDIVMPEKEGLETILELRRKHGAKKIIAMSGGGRMSPDAYLKIAQQMGATKVLLKPFSNEELLKAINETLATP